MIGGGTIFLFSNSCLAQSSSYGPGKGPSRQGEGKSKYTYPQPPKPKQVQPSALQPGSEVPEHPERFIWKLTSNVNGHPPTKPTNEIPVYTFDDRGFRVQIGTTPIGEEIALEEVRAHAKRNFYKFPWNGLTALQRGRFGLNPEFWVDGANVEYAGTK